MGTRSRIAVQRDIAFESIYCHWDGYLKGVGKTLIEHYTDPAKVNALLALGDCSSLDKRVRPDAGEAHSFDKAADDVTVAYLDRGETDCPSLLDKSFDELLKRADDSAAEYLYVFVDGVWLFSAVGQFRSAVGLVWGPEARWTPLAVLDKASIAAER